MSDTTTGLKLNLADGQRWLVRPLDAGAAAIVAELGRVMRLEPGDSGRELCVAVCPDGLDALTDARGTGAVLACVAEPTNRDALTDQMLRVTSMIIRGAISRGGLLLHGALAEHRGSGFVLAGPSGIGKSTASRRLPSPWRSLSDDMTLVVQDGKGCFWAHPWPTWSRFHGDGPGGSWAVEQAVPLRVMLFLDRSMVDGLELVNPTQTAALTLASAGFRPAEDGVTQTLLADGVRTAQELATAVPAYSLRVSPDGRFWEQIERVLPLRATPAAPDETRDRCPRPADLLIGYLSAGRQPTDDRRLPTTADWNEAVDTAARHNLAPLLFRRLKQSGGRVHVPPEVWKQLRQAYFSSANWRARLYREFGSVLRRLRESGIRVIVLKGAFLAEAVYGDVALRPMCDADFMVSKEDLPRVQEILLDIGYGPQAREDIEFLCRRTKGLAPFYRADYNMEPHWHIVHPTSSFTIDVAGLWHRARPATIAGVEVLGLSPEDLLLHLCLHISHKHTLWLGLQPLCDIAEAIRHYDGKLNWPQLSGRAHEWGAERYAGLTLQLAKNLLGADVPEAVLEQLVPGGIDQNMLDTAKESVLAQTGYEQWVPLFDSFGARTFREKVKATGERVFLSRAEMATVYPVSRDSKCLWPYYALRLRDAIRTYGYYVLTRGRLKMQSRGRDRNADLVKWLRER